MTLRCGCGEIVRAAAIVRDAELVITASMAGMLAEFLQGHSASCNGPISIEANAFPSPMSYKGRKRSNRVG